MVSKATQNLAINLPASVWSKDEQLTRIVSVLLRKKQLKPLSTCWFNVDDFIHVDQINGGQRVQVPQAKF